MCGVVHSVAWVRTLTMTLLQTFLFQLFLFAEITKQHNRTNFNERHVMTKLSVSLYN